jgi:hypothetical protein
MVLPDANLMLFPDININASKLMYISVYKFNDENRFLRLKVSSLEDRVKGLKESYMKGYYKKTKPLDTFEEFY